MQFPLLSIGTPNYINYGLFGTIVAHEFSHFICTQGRHYDESGNLNNFWQNSTIKRYDENAECLVKQYDRERMNGRGMLSENIADNIALKLIFKVNQVN